MRTLTLPDVPTGVNEMLKHMLSDTTRATEAERAQFLKDEAEYDAIETVTEQRDRLAEALESIVGESAYEGLPESKQQAIEQALDCTCECPIPNNQ